MAVDDDRGERVIVFAADLHLAPLIWQDMASLSGDAYRAFMQIVQHCIDEKASALILGGDIFDKPRPDSQSVAVFMEEMARLAKAKIPVYAIQGQHERADPPWACLDDHVQCIGDGVMYEIEDDGATITLCGFDNTSAEQLKEAIATTDPAPDILIVHQLAKQLVPFEGAWDFDLKWVPKHTKLVLAGDYHIHAHEGKLWYPGSTHMRNISERGAHCFMQIWPEMTEKSKGRGKKKKTVREWTEKFTIGTHPIRTRPVIECTINADSHIDEALATITGHTLHDHLDDDELQSLVYLQYNPQIEDALSRVEAVCKKNNYFLRTKVTVGGTEIVDGVPQLGAVKLEECLSQAVNREQEPEFFSFMLGMLTGDHKAVFASAKEQFGLAKENN